MKFYRVGDNCFHRRLSPIFFICSYDEYCKTSHNINRYFCYTLNY
nr:MAG TPA: hypothetical protein [Microviridae sp.]